MEIKKSTAQVELNSGFLRGEGVSSSQKKLGQITHLFADQAAVAAMDADTVVCEVQSHEAVAEGTPGGLFFGTSTVHPGRVVTLRMAWKRCG